MQITNLLPALLGVFLLLGAADACGQDEITRDLPALVPGARVQNRAASVHEVDEMRFVRLDAREGDGMLWIPSLEFQEGTIDIRLRGRNEPGRSFVGIAFNSANDSTYEAVYVRPFNFRADNPVQRARSIQYIAMPHNPWHVLRESAPGEFESATAPIADPDQWLRLRVRVEPNTVSVYAGEGAQPDLVARRLAHSQPGRIGLWVGHNSEGDFASLSVEHADAPSTGSIEIENVEFHSQDARISGSIAFPGTPGADAAVVFVAGSGTMPRNISLARRLAEEGIATLVYDKRGTGRSGGTYAGDMSISGPNMDLLAVDAVAAIETLRTHPRLRDVPVGFVGYSQAGWIIPLAAERTTAAAFLGLWSGPVCKLSEEDLFSIYTSDRDLPDVIPFEEMRALREEPYEWPARLGRDTDAVESLSRLDLPGFWIFGADDGSIPVDLSIQNLTNLVRDIGAPYDYTLFAGAGHATIDRGFGAMVDWIQSTVRNRAWEGTPRPSPNVDALAGTYLLPDPGITATVASTGASVSVEVRGSTLALEPLDGMSFVGHEPGTGYVVIDFEPNGRRFIATEQGRSYTFERQGE